MIIDTSALLAVLFRERYAEWVAEQMASHNENLRMSTVNLAETLILVKARQPHLFGDVESRLLDGTLAFVPPTTAQARLAAEARLRFPLNLGDCFAYALAKDSGSHLLTLDSDFRKTDARLRMP